MTRTVYVRWANAWQVRRQDAGRMQGQRVGTRRKRNEPMHGHCVVAVRLLSLADAGIGLPLRFQFRQMLLGLDRRRRTIDRLQIGYHRLA